jgi:2-succinyl-6-hydroxy-2,4-cyclohexadiene-1-carboxylate synthase
VSAVDPMVLLHGFAGTGRSWESVDVDGAVAPDLHTLRPATFDGIVAGVLGLVPGRFALGGYSMGARCALQVALAAPRRVSSLALVAGTAGIDGEEERRIRAAGDAAMATRMRAASPDGVVRLWCDQPIFAGQPPAARAQQEADVRATPPGVLADALSALSTGRMRPMWGDLGRLTMPAVVVVGERDAKYVALGERLVDGLPDAELVVVAGAGHGLLREAPDAVAAAIRGLRARTA